MFARVQTFDQPVEKLDELSTLTRQQLEVSTPPGLSGFYYLIDRDNARGLLISLWETEEALRQLEATNAPTREHVNAAGVEVPRADVFEVILHSTTVEGLGAG